MSNTDDTKSWSRFTQSLNLRQVRTLMTENLMEVRMNEVLNLQLFADEETAETEPTESGNAKTEKVDRKSVV